jgi:LETM1 and EF-hand domain-containing protein 1
VLSGQRLASGRLQLSHYARVGRKVSARSASTSTSSNDKSSHTSNLPPSAVSPRKHRVELKPGPLKRPSPSNATPKLQSISPKKTQPSFPAFRPSPTSSTPDSVPSAIELAKQDIADATAQGVLRPAPHDAGTIKRFTHQAFELLVCV